MLHYAGVPPNIISLLKEGEVAAVEMNCTTNYVRMNSQS